MLNTKSAIIAFIIGLCLLMAAETCIPNPRVNEALRLQDGNSAVYWVSEPVKPGQTVLAYGTGLDAVTTAHLVGGSDLEIIQKSSTCVSFKIPKTTAMGEYRVELGGSAKLTIGVNTPETYWAQETTASDSSKRIVRIFGRCLQPVATAPSVQFVGPQGSTPISVVRTSMYEIAAEIPENTAPGDYRIDVKSTSTDGTALVDSTTLHLEAKKSSSATPTDFVSKGDGKDDVSSLLQSSLDQVGQKGGGVIRIPRGMYMLAKPLSIPAGVELEGASEGATFLFFSCGDPLPHELVTLHRHVRLANMTLIANDYQDGLVDGKAGDNDSIVLDHVRLRLLRYSGLTKEPDFEKQLQRVQTYTLGTGTAVLLSGSGFEISNCDLYTASRSLTLQGASNGWIHDSFFGNGHLGWYKMDGVRNLIFEHNTVEGVDPAAVGGGFGATIGYPVTENLVFQNCLFHQFNGGNREALTSDSPHGLFSGTITKSSGTTLSVDRVADKDDQKWIGGGVYVLGGKGKGQYRSITKVDGGTIELNQPWITPLDATSYISIAPLVRRGLILNNVFADTGPCVQFYGASTEMTVSGNTASRVVDFASYGFTYHGGQQPSWYVQWLDNKIPEGMNYSVHTTNISMVPTFLGAISLSSPDIKPTPLLVAGQVFRGNVLENGAYIHLGSRAVGSDPDFDGSVIEDNSINGADIGIEISGHPESLYIGDNSISDCRVPLQDARKAKK